MHVSMIDNTYVRSDEIVSGDAFDPSWDELVALLSEYIVVSEREEMSLFNLSEFEDGFVRGSTNVKRVHGIVLDIDDGFTIARFLATYSDLFAFHLYTSWSHQMVKGDIPACDRYRVVIPFKVPVEAHWLAEPHSVPIDMKTVLPELSVCFPFVDPTGFYTEHWFWVPVVHPDNEHLVRVHTNQGAFFDPRELTPTKGKWKQVIKAKRKPARSSLDKFRGNSRRGYRPVDWKTCDLPNLFSNSGLVKGQSGDKVHVRCPWEHNHSSVNKTQTTLVRRGGQWKFSCFSSGCKNVWLKDIREFFGEAEHDALCEEAQS